MAAIMRYFTEIGTYEADDVTVVTHSLCHKNVAQKSTYDLWQHSRRLL